jgi:choline dehydrogenase-like flavoprotein
MRVKKSKRVHDVIVVGSGASGGMAAWNLTRQGVKVLMLDAGTRFHRADFWTHVKPWERTDRIARGENPPRIYLDTAEQPYETPPDQPFALTRVWGRGGKTNVWGRVSLRYSDLDFTAAERDGWEIPWPIRYADIKPYYDRVDHFIGVCGGDDDQDCLPGSQYHLPAPAPRCGERLLQKAGRSIGIPIVAGRRAVLTRAHNGHPACHYCGNCGSGCDVGAFFNSSDYLIEPALKTGKLEIIDNAVVARVLVDDRGRANGVQYFDRITKEEHEVRARVVVMGASCIDSTRILLNSKSHRYPNGIGNSNDVIGRYLCEQIRIHVFAFVPELMDGPTLNDDGIGGEHVYMPRFNHRADRQRDYLRGFGMQFWGCGAQGDAAYAKVLPGFGIDFKRAVKSRYPALVALHPFGEALPRPENRVTVENTPLDRYGIPIARIEYKTGENERKMAAHMADTIDEILHTAKAEVLPYDRERLDNNGSAIHEHSTCRMGADPKRSALNGFCQMHEVPNLFVVDGSAFTTSTEKNPTLTILALAWRSTDYLAGEMRNKRL